MDVEKLGKNVIKSVSTNQTIALESLWQTQTCVIIFFRRFGCQFCRNEAKMVSEIKPQLDAAGVRLIGVCFEDIGVKEFVDGGYLDGELYIDTERKCYKDLNYKRLSLLATLSQALGKEGRAAIAESKRRNIPGNLKGDGQQFGGAIIISAGGKECLFQYVQEQVAQHVSNEQVLAALGLNSNQSSVPSTSVSANPTVECSGEVCN